METIVETAISEDSPAIYKAADFIRAGELVAFPTETVYGLGANGLNPEAVEKIFIAKGRPQDNPLILHIADMGQLDELIEEPLDDWTRGTLSRIWPGPITFIFKRSRLVPDVVTAGGDTVAIRMPANDVARKLIQYSGCPIAAPSANISGKPSPTRMEDVLEDMDGRIAMILDGGFSPLGVESTVVDLTRMPPAVLRPGFYSQFTLRNFWPDILSPEDLGGDERIDPAPQMYIAPFEDDEKLDKELGNCQTQEAGIDRTQKDENYLYVEELLKSLSIGLKDDEIPRAPGMKYRHYAPKAKMTVYLGDQSKVAQRMVEEAGPLINAGSNIGFMVFQNQAKIIKNSLGAVHIGDMGDGHDLVTMSQQLFLSMRELDRCGCDQIFCVGVEPRHVGSAIMNRLRKASAGNIIVVN